MKSSVLRTRQIKNNWKPKPCWRQAPITIVIVGNHGLGSGMKLLEGEMKLYIYTQADFILPDNSRTGRWVGSSLVKSIFVIFQLAKRPVNFPSFVIVTYHMQRESPGKLIDTA